MMIRLFLILSIACIMGCGELNMNVTDMLEVAEDINEDNPDFKDASRCLLDADSSSHKIDGEYIDTVRIELDKACLQDIIVNKSDVNLVSDNFLHANILDTHGDEFISSITVRGEDMREYEIDLTLNYNPDYLSLSDRVIIKLTNPLQKGVYEYSGYVVDNLTSGRTWIN